MQLEQSSPEKAWFQAIDGALRRVFVGLDHHSRQVTVAAASGEEFHRSSGRPTAKWLRTVVFTQDGLGYIDLLEWLEERFPGVPRDHFTFLAEPTYAKPLSQFLASAGFAPDHIQWVRTNEVGPYRKSRGIGKAGKNDPDDARALATWAFEAAASPFARKPFLPAVRRECGTQGMKRLATDYWRLTDQSIRLRNQITDLVILLFPECRRVWYQVEKVLKPDGTRFDQRMLRLFDSPVPLRILGNFPGARAIARAGYDEVWATAGGSGTSRKRFKEIVALAERSGGVDSPLDGARLRLLIEEYQQVQGRLTSYRQTLRDALEADPVFASFFNLPCMVPQTLATIVGALGDVSRFRDFDAAKKYLNIAPVPMPQTGTVDPEGRPVQIWRFPANTYDRRRGQRRLIYEIPGRQDVRQVLYVWFGMLVKQVRARPDDPLVQYYLRLKAQHQGKPRWFGKVRWKVAAKLISVVFHCMKTKSPYEPARLLEVAGTPE